MPVRCSVFGRPPAVSVVLVLQVRQRLRALGFPPRKIGELIAESRPAVLARNPDNDMEEMITDLEAREDEETEA